MLLSSELNTKMDREHTTTNVTDSRRHVVRCRFAVPVVFEVVVQVHKNNKEQNPTADKDHE